MSSEDYDVLSMSETEDYPATDASMDDVTAVGSGLDVNGNGNSNDNYNASDSEGGSTSADDSALGTESEGFDPGSGSDAIEATPPPSPSSIRRKFEPIEALTPSTSTPQPSMYHMPWLSTEVPDSEAYKSPLPSKHWQLSCLNSRPFTRKHPSLIIAVFGYSEGLVREVISKLLPAIPRAQYLWVHRTSAGDLVASEFVAANKPFDSNPVLPSRTQRSFVQRYTRTDNTKLIFFFTYTTDAVDKQDGDKSIYPYMVNNAPGKRWECPAAPVVPVTSVFLGTNDLNKRCRIVGSADAPLLRNPNNVFTPLPVDCLDMFDEDMLLAMDPNAFIAYMTTPDRATAASLWPAELLPPDRYVREPAKGQLPVGPILLLCLWFCMMVFYATYQIVSSVPPAQNESKDLQVWQAGAPGIGNFFYRLFFAPSPDVEPYAVSTIVAKSGDALLDHIRLIHLEVLRSLAYLVDKAVLYGRKGSTLVYDALRSERARDLKLNIESTGRRLKNSQAVEDALRRAKDGLVVANNVGTRSARKLAELYGEARDSDTMANVANFSKNLWSKYVQFS